MAALIAEASRATLIAEASRAALIDKANRAALRDLAQVGHLDGLCAMLGPPPWLTVGLKKHPYLLHLGVPLSTTTWSPARYTGRFGHPDR